MRIFRVFGIFAGMFCLAVEGHAQSIPDALIAGQVASALAYGQPGWCAITQGNSAIQENQTTGIAVISFPELTLFDGTTYYLLNGQARLRFKSKTSGIIRFTETAYSNTVISPTFSGFSKSTVGINYIVSFMVTFSNNCVLPITASFRAP